MEKHIIGFSMTRAPPPKQGCEYGIQGKRESMEDEAIYAQWFCRPAEGRAQKLVMIQLFGVFDGHGGGDASKLVSQLLPSIVAQNLTGTSLGNRDVVKKVLVQSFRQMQAYMQLHNPDRFQRQGTTAVLIVKIKNHIYCANAGDSRAVLCSSIGPTGTPQIADLSKDHKPSNPQERQRILSMGGYINPSSQGTPRVWESPQQRHIGLATSRSLGDLESLTPEGKYLVSPVPDVTANVLEKNETGFIILACDGVWDVLTSPRACQIVRKVVKSRSKTETPCQSLVHTAYQKGSTDNITAMVIYLNISV